MSIKLKSADVFEFYISDNGYLCFTHRCEGTDEDATLCISPEQFSAISAYVNDNKDQLTILWNNGIYKEDEGGEK